MYISQSQNVHAEIVLYYISDLSFASKTKTADWTRSKSCNSIIFPGAAVEAGHVAQVQ